MRRACFVVAGWLLAVLPMLAGCPVSDGAKGQTADTCTEIGTRCRTPEGPIGVCNDTGRTDCAEPPCLACIPQH